MGGCYSNNSIKNKDENNLNLTPYEIDFIRNSWKLVTRDDGLTKYGTNMMIRVFFEHKELKYLWRFAKDLETAEQMNSSQLLKAHGLKLFNAIDLAIKKLDDLNTLIPILIQLGFSHYVTGVRDEHFPYIGESLISTLQDGLKDNFNTKTKNAWIKMLNLVEYHMKIGMKQAASSPIEKIDG